MVLLGLELQNTQAETYMGQTFRGAGRVFALVRQNLGGGSGGPPPENF